MPSGVSAQRPGSVVVIDHDHHARVTLEALIGQRPELHFAGSAPSLREGLALTAACQPDLVITAMRTTDSRGLATVRAVIAAQQPRATLVLSLQDELRYGQRVLALGARGYVMKGSADALVIGAALAVLHGGRWLSPRLNAKLFHRFLARVRPAPPEPMGQEPPVLTPREFQVLELLQSGGTSSQIARALDLSVRTVDIHRANIKRKLRLHVASARS